MVSNQNAYRIETLKLKATIIRKIGDRRAEKYFDHLRRLFSFKLTKCEFNKLCFRTMGRENIPFHNRLIRSLLKNASLTKVPPPRTRHQKNVPSSPRILRSDLKFQDRPSPLGQPQDMARQESPTELLSLGSRPPIELGSVEEGEEVEQTARSPGVQSRNTVTAPIGVSVCGARKALSNASTYNSYNLETCQNIGELPDTRMLRNRLEQRLGVERIGVPMDCVNLLNNGLDAYLRRVIEPCLGLAGSRSLFVPGCLNGRQRPVSASLLDFRVAMEMNPELLGEDWPVQLEKISLHDSRYD